MIKYILILICFFAKTNCFSQSAVKKVHAFKMQVIHNTDASSKGWLSCDFFIEFNNNKNELKSISLSSNNKNLMINVKKNGGEKFNYSSYTEADGTEYRWYQGFDDLTGEDVKMLIGYKTYDKQLNPISITMIYMLSSTYFSLNYP